MLQPQQQDGGRRNVAIVVALAVVLLPLIVVIERSASPAIGTIIMAVYAVLLLAVIAGAVFRLRRSR